MAIFDKELIDNVSDRTPDGPRKPLPSPTVKDVDVSLGGFEMYGNPDPGKTGLNIDQLSEFSGVKTNQSSFSSPVQMVPRSELLANQRYNTYQRNVDLENIYGLQQSWLDQLANGVVKMAGLGAGTFLQSFATIPNTVSAIKNGKLSDLSGGVDGYESAIDNWTKNIEDYFPNYFTREEKKHPYLAMLPFAPGSANFWGDKIIKNLGFTAGAVGGAIAQDAAIGLVTEGIGSIPLVAAQIGKASLFLNKIFTGTNNVEKVLDVAKTAGVAADKLLDVKKLGSIAEYTKVTDGFRYGMSIYGSARTEAAIEARDSYRTVREELLRQYKLENAGVDPTGEDAEQIEDYATSAMNTRFGINMALLTASNAIQFGNLFKSFTSSNKAISGQLTKELEDFGKIGLKEGSKDVFEAKVATGLKDRVWESVRPKLANVLTEGVYEEGGQYSAEKGIYDYFTRKYKNLSDPKNKETWNETNEIVSSTLTGLKNQFGSSEGLENMIVGAISALISGGIMGKIDAAKGEGKEARLQSAINILNQYGLTGTLTNQYENTLNSSAIAKEMDEAVKAGDIFKYKNLKNDMFINFVQSRIPSGMHDVTVEQLKMLKDLDKAEFEKSFGMDFNSSNKSTVNEYVDSLITEANGIKKIYDSINFTFKNPYKQSIDPKTDSEEIENNKYNDFNKWKTELLFLSAKVPHISSRLNSIQESVATINPAVTNDLISQITNKESLKDLSTIYEDKANQLNKTVTEFTSPQDNKRIKDQIKALRTASEKINIGLKSGIDEKLFDYLLNFELNNQDAKADRQVGPESAVELFNYGHDINRNNALKQRVVKLYDDLTSEKGFNKFMDQADQLRSSTIPEEEDKEEKEIIVKEGPQFVNKAGEKQSFEEGREYQIPQTKKAKVVKIADDRFEVVSPDGTSTFYPTKEKAEEAADDINQELGNLQKAKVVAINDDGTIKIEDINGDIYNIDPSRFDGYEKVETEQEKLQKFKQDVEEDQKDIEHTSGTIASKENTAKTSTDFNVEDKKKGIEWLFTSTSGASEDWESGKLSPAQQRAIVLRNNYKNLPNRNNLRIILVTQNQEESLGLSGLTALSMTATGADSSTYTNVEDGFIGAVYVEQDGSDVYFVDKNGKKLGKVGDKVDINEVVFDTMPTTSLTWSNKENRYRGTDSDRAQEYADRWRTKRKQLFDISEGKYEIYKFSVSPGIPDIVNVSDNNAVGETLIPENEIAYQQGLIVIPTTGTVQHQGRNLKFPDGVPVFQYRDVLTFLKTRKFTKAESRAIFDVMRKMSEDIKLKLDQGKKIKSNRKYTRFLQNVLYWRKSSSTDKNQIFIDYDTMDFFFGGKRYDLTNLGASEAEIIEQLENVYANINNDSLTKNFSEKFNEYYIDGSGNLATRQWDNYQSYLLSSKYPDGSNRATLDIPLTTPIQKPTNLKPFNFKQKYSILDGVELPALEVKPVVKPAATTTPAPSGQKIGEYTADDSTQNVYQLKNGPVGFTATVTDGVVNISVSSNDTIKKIADNKDVIRDVIIPTLKSEQGDKFNATETDEEHVLSFVSLKIANDLQKQLNASVAPAPQAAVLQPNVSPLAQAQGTARTEPVLTAAPKNFSGTKPPPNTEYRRVGAEGVERISSEEIDLFKTWAAEKVPGIPYEITENILTTHDNEKAWGAFEQGVAKFYKSAARGTEYHEIFEGVWKGFLSEGERQAILDEFKAKEGEFKDRQSGKMIAYVDATDQQAKERIADDFADFRLGKLPARSIGERILRFFRSIIEFFKQFVQKPSMKEDLFKAIDTGKFKEKVLPESVKNDFAEYRAVEGLTEEQTHDFVQDITARIFQIAFGTNMSLYNPEQITAPQIFAEIKERYQEEGKLELLSENAWRELVGKTRNFLRTFKIDFDEEGILGINDENYNKNDYAREAFSTDWKKSSPFPIKLVMGTLTETVPTSQVDTASLDLPKQKLSSVNGYKILNFARTFATALDKFANTTNVTKLVDKLIELSRYDSNYVRLFTRLKGDRNTVSIDFSKFEEQDWRLFINFYQTFTKQKPDAVIQYVGENNEVYNGAANLFSAVEEFKRGWIENVRTLANKNTSLVYYYSPDKTFRTKKIDNIPIDNPQQMVTFLDDLGINFPFEVYQNLKDSQQRAFGRAVSAIRKYASEKEIGKITGETLTINGQLNTLAELYIKATNPNIDSTYFGVDGKRQQSYADSNAPSVFENVFNEAETLDSLLSERPELNDAFSTNSLILKKGGPFFDKDGKRTDRKLKVGYIQGTKDTVDDKGTPTSKLGLGERFTQEFNQNVLGNYYILIPADGSTEWMLNIGNHVNFEDFEAGDANSEIHKIFRGYLNDEIELALSNRSYLKNIGSRGKELRFFKDVLSEKTLKELNKLIEEGNKEKIKKFVDDNISDINTSVDNYINGTVEDSIKDFTNNSQIFQVKEGVYSFPSLNDKFAKEQDVNKFDMSEDELMALFKFANTNYIINNIEFHKIIFGDPYQFKIKDNQLDETKRIKSFLSPRRVTFDSPEFNTWLNSRNKAGDIMLSPGDPGYHQYKSYTSTVTTADVDIVGSIAMMKDIPKNIKSAYENTNEADAASLLMDSTYKEIKLKNGQWSKEAEDWHQWQMAYTRNRMSVKGLYTYTNDNLKKQDEQTISSPAPKHKIEVLKPIVSGSKHNKNAIDLVLDKFSQMPIYYSTIEGTNLENLYLKMMKEDIGYVIMISGRKVGAEQLHNLYTADGSFNEAAFNNRIEVPWKAYGIQVETTTEDDKYQTRGSQLTKMSSMDLFSNGEPLGKTPERQKVIKNAYDRNKEILDKMHENSYKDLLNKLGVEDLGDSFKVIDNINVSESLEYEMLRRELSDNAIDTVKLDENNQFRIPFEASPAYLQIRSIMFSMVDKALVSPKMSGGAHVQVPVTLWESATKGRSLAYKTKDGWKKISKDEYNKLSEEDKKKVALTDDTLKFYTKEDPYTEVLLPHWFKDKFPKSKFKTDGDILNYLNNTEEGREILTGVGFRIPTQATSSVEVFRVKGFLPQYMGATVVVPSEITTKSGSDFDIDKLNIYLKSIYVNARGDVKLIKYLGSEEKTKSFFSDEFDRILENKAIKKAELFEAVDILAYNLADPKNLIKKYENLLDVLLQDYNDVSDLSDSLMKDLEKLGDKAVQSKLKEKFVNQTYKQSLENEYYSSLEELLTLPEVFERLISPVSDGGLKKLSERMDELTGVDEGKIKNRLLNRSYMTSLRHAFVSAKKWVGIAAVNITGHSLFQKSQIYLDPERFSLLTKSDVEILGDGSIVLPHNTVTVNGNSYVSMSGAKTADGKQYISDRLSGYGTSFVDVAKDPYIMKIIKSESVVGVFMFLERIGAGEKAAIFMNQPIISNYLNYLDSIGYKSLFNKKNITKALLGFPAKAETFRTAGINVDALEENIKKYSDNNNSFTAEIDNAVQQKIFFEFLKYAKMAEFSFSLTQGYNYDTTRFKSGDSLFKKQTRTQQARDKNIFSSIDKVLNNSFIGEQAFLIDKSTEALGEFLKLENPKLRIISDTVLKPFAEKKYLSADDYERIGNKITSAFLDFIIQTKTNLNDKIKELLVTPGTAVATQLAEAQAKFPENKLLNELQVISSDRVDGAKSIKLRVNDKTAYSENLYQGMFRQLRDNPETNALYNNIVKLAILQGTYQSSISIRNVIPIEDFSREIAPVMRTLIATPELEAFAKGAFQRNNWKNSDVWGTVSPKFFARDKPIRQIDTPGGDVIDIFQYSSPAFPDIPNLNIKGDDRKILTLNEAYNYLDVQNDFLLVPAIVTDRKTGDMIDVKTGTTVTRSMIAQMKEKGDMSYKNVYGYQKVRYEGTGDPLLTYDKDGNAIHIYKLINLLGDGAFASEYYNVYKPSVFNNGTEKIDNEIPDADIINHYAPRTTDPKPVASVAPIEESTVKKKELFSFEKGIVKKSFRGKTLNFVDKIPTQKETVVAMQNNRQTGVITVDYKAMIQKFDDKAWTKPAKQLDGSFATPLAEDEFKNWDEWFTFALLHEVKHDTILKEPGETTGQYEDRINQAALQDLNDNYIKSPVVDKFPNKDLNIKDQKCN